VAVDGGDHDRVAPDAVNRVDRRQFLVVAAAVSGTGWLAVNAPAVLAAAEAAGQARRAGGSWKHLEESEARTLGAVADQIIPPDDLPGAVDAGVLYFIDAALGGFLAGSEALLRDGAADLDRRASSAGDAAGSFADLPFAAQTATLSDIESTPFFRQMIFLTHCGMFAMPSWGGNRDQAGWKLLGFDSRHAWEPPFGYYDAPAAAQKGADDAG
jgi:gluconate 2-dehydrogenase gamma chain